MKTVVGAAIAFIAIAATGCGSEGEGIGLGRIFGGLAPRSRQEVLEQSVQSAEPDKRRKALYEMSKWKGADQELVTLVGLTVLGDSDAMTRVQAARTLAAWGHPSAVRYLGIGLAGRAGAGPATPAAAQASSEAAVQNESEVALPRLPDASELVRLECAVALGKIGHVDGRRALSRGLQLDPDEDVRAACAEAMRSLRNEEAARMLTVGLADGSLSVRRAALASLRYMTGQDFGWEAAAWDKYFAETGEPLAQYGHPPKVKSAEPQGQVSPGGVAKIKGIFADLFPLERQEGPFE